MENTKGIALSRVSPAFLHANSTSHTWAFSAIAELIDNAYDPDVNASELWIDKVDANGKTYLTFTDNGAGLDPEKLIKMLSFGFCEKSVYEGRAGHQPIGHYGNGFKSGSMRIAEDVIVFTRHLHKQSVGMLSQTFLNRTNAETVVVPMVTWDNKTRKRSQSEETINNLRAITTYSGFETEDRLLAELKELEKLQTGTRIILYNLKRDKTGKLELDFESDPTDILNPQTLEIDTTSVYRPVQESIARYQVSLREYCSILFLKPRMKIILRGLKVKTKLIRKSLSQTEIDRYKPHWLDRPMKITYGFTCNQDNEDEYGIMMYHRNRLIKAFEKVGYQKQANELGVGVVGIVEVNFLQPIHNKQDFNKDERYNTFMTALASKTNEYWNEKKKSSNINGNTGGISIVQPDWLWAQCDNCLKWRRLPDAINRNLPDKWYCYMNPDASHNRCEIEEEPEDEDLSLQYAYKKTVKLEREKEKRKSRVEEHQILIKKEKDLKEREEKFKARVKTVEKICNDVKTTEMQQKKKTEGLQRLLEQAQKREAEQRKIILELQAKRDEVSRHKKELCQVAENLCTTNYETISSDLQPNSKVTSTSDKKRKNTDSPRRSKKLIIQDQDSDEVVAIIPDSSDTVVIDLVSDNEADVKPDPKLVEKNKAMQDKKPDIKELEKYVHANLDKSNNAKSSASVPSNSEQDKLEKETKVSEEAKETSVSNTVSTMSTEVQTSKVIVTSEEEFSDIEEKAEKLMKTEKQLKSLQSDIYSLLSIIVPGIDLGDVSDIQKIIKEMIHVNKESSSQDS